MTTIRQRVVASVTRRYPFYSGCGSLANQRMVQRFAGAGGGDEWMKCPGGKVLASLDDYVGRAIFYAGDLDRKITWICKRLVRPGDVVLDIGANVGLVSLLLSQLVGKEGKVHAFEPNPRLQAMLGQSFAQAPHGNIKLHPVALGETEGRLSLHIPQGNFGAGSLVHWKEAANCQVFEVEVKRLDDLFHEAGGGGIRLIKIDVEGFEAPVFRGAFRVLRELQPHAILFELNDVGGFLADQPVVQVLAEAGYGFFAVPQCLLRMRLKRLDLAANPVVTGHDLLAVPRGDRYEEVASLCGAS